MLYDYTIFPLECVYKIVYLGWYELLQSYGVALIALSFTAHIVLAPLIEWGKRFQAEENRLQEILQPQIAAIKENFHGAAAHKELAWLYKRYGYHPAMAVRSAMMVLVQLPFLMAAYYMLSALPDIEGISFGAIVDLSEPDGLLGGVNLLPIAMTLLNFGATFGQPNFSRRDRVQAVVIALLFLLLLYDAPSALLVYWTGNNFWMFAESLGQQNRQFVKIAAVFGAGQAKLWSIVKKNCVPLALSLTLCLFVPLDFYLSNADEIWFTAPEILPYLLTATLVLWLLLSLPIKFLPPKGKIFYGAALLGLTIGAFGQSYLLNPDYGQLNGIEIQWEKYRVYGIMSLIIWLFVLSWPLRYVKKWLDYPLRIRTFFAYGSTLIVVAQIIPLCYVGATQNVDKHYKNTLTTQNMLTVSAHDNIIVLLLDMFDTRFFQEIQRENPELVAELDGFTYYPDAISVFDTTAYSLPQMLTGVAYDNKKRYTDYVAAAWHNNKFYELLQANNYAISIFTDGEFVSDEAPVDNLVTATQGGLMYINRRILMAYGKMVLFRVLPHFAKHNFVTYTTDLWQQEQTDDGLHPYSDDNLTFYHRLERGLTLTEEKNAFRWYHLNGAHMPFIMTQDLEYVDPGETTMQRQAVGAFKIALAYLRQLKDLGVYDNATIAILADHGKHSESEADAFDKIKPLPLVLVKQPGEKGVLRESDHSVSYDNLLATLGKRLTKNDDILGSDFATHSDDERIYRLMPHNNGEHPMTLYRVQPDADKNTSWQQGEVIAYTPSSNNDDYSYHLGKTIDFGSGHNNMSYLKGDWWRTVPAGTVSNGKNPSLQLNLLDVKAGKDLVLRVTAMPYLNDTVKVQEVVLSVNGQYITTWRMTRVNATEYTAKIPAQIAEQKNLNLCFSINNPGKFWTADGGYIYLGFAIQKLTLTYAN